MARSTDIEGIYHISGNSYVSHTHDNTYQLTERMDFTSNTFSRSMLPTGTPAHVVSEIQKTISEQAAYGNTNLEISVFVPVGSNVSTADIPQNPEFIEDQSWYEYEGRPFLEYTVYYPNM